MDLYEIIYKSLMWRKLLASGRLFDSKTYGIAVRMQDEHTPLMDLWKTLN